MVELSRTQAIVERGLAEGLHAGTQIYASRAGETVVDLALGDSRPGVAMIRDSLVLWMSSTKPMVAAAVLQLVERGQLELDEPVARWIPEFAAGGKQAITIRQVLTHTGGFRLIDLGWPDTSWAEIIDRICQAKLDRNWTPGERAGYHPQTGWYILAELVRRADGRPFSQFVRQEIFEPLGMLDCWIGMPRERFFEYGNRIGLLPDMTRANHPPQRYSSEQGATDCIPGAGGLGPMRQLVMFYEMLLGHGQRQGVRILTPESAKLMTTRQRTGMYDETFRHTMDWGLGMIINSARYGHDVPYGYGQYASEETFGHGGAQSSVGFADPKWQLAVGCYFNGMPGEPQHQARIRAVLDALYEDLQLAG